MDPQETPQTPAGEPVPQQTPEQAPVPPQPTEPSTPPTPPVTPQENVQATAGVLPQEDITHKNIWPVLITIIVLILVASGIFWWMGQQPETTEPVTPPVVETIPIETPTSRTVLSLAETNKIVSAITNNDLDLLADFVSPTKGVRISRDGSIKIEDDAVLTQSLIRNANANRSLWLWGYEDGTGEPVQETIYGYLTKNIYTRDFLNAEEILVNEPSDRASNAILNIDHVYPTADVVEYHFSSGENGEELGWESLYLILENVGTRYYLIGIIKSNWTI